MRVLCAASIWLGALIQVAHAESRFALLIGNQNYSHNVGPLKNPHNDIELVGAVLEKLGFKVMLIKDAGYKRIETALKIYNAQVRRAGQDAISFVYYSGHGASDPDTQINYLIPVDVDGTDEASIWTNSLELGDIVNKLRDQSPNATHYVVFDACREELHLTHEGKKAVGAERGFVAVGSVTGVMIAYATAPGRTASDVGQGAGPYAKALTEEIVKPGLEAVTMFRNVQLKVREAIGQDPWLSFPTLPAVYFAGKITMPEGPGAERQFEIAFWDSVKEKKDPIVVAAYLERYPKGEFAPAARKLIEQYEQQLRAERAAREEEQRRQDKARKAAEVTRLEEERQAREEALAQERRRAEEIKDLAETNRNEDQERAELTARADELRKALEEARVAREAAKVAEEQRLAAVRAAEEARSRAKLASLPIGAEAIRYPENIADDPVALARALQTELKRVGCYSGDADEKWGAKAQTALEHFVRQSNTDVPTGEPSKTALQVVGRQKERVCPLLCAAGEQESDGKCVGKAERARRKPRVAATPTASSRVGGRRSSLPDYRPYGYHGDLGGPGSKGWMWRSFRSTHQE
jgi:hypothetical protein